MDVAINDAGFVRAPVDLVYRRITDVPTWSTWWPGLRTRRLPPGSDPGHGQPSADRERWGVEIRPGPASVIRFGLAVVRRRPGVGMDFVVEGDLHGRGEFWMEAMAGGTVVHHLMTATTSLRWPIHLQRRYRRSVRRALWGLKDTLQSEMRTSMGVTS